MKLIVGLGNPGKKYELTRHNIGFLIVDYLADLWDVSFAKGRDKGEIAECFHQGEKVFLLKPQTYMNLSGFCVASTVNFYRIPVENVIIVYDDLDLALGRIRIRKTGSAGGHRGMQSIINHLQTKDILRLKVGIGRNEDPAVDHVLGRFSQKEWEIIKETIPVSTKALVELLTEDVERVMSKYN